MGSRSDRLKAIYSPDDARVALEEGPLGRPVNAAIWQQLCRDGRPQGVARIAKSSQLEGQEALESLHQRYVQLEAMAQEFAAPARRPRISAAAPKQTEARDNALAQVVAIDAARLPYVRHLRARWDLEAQLLPRDAVEAWMRTEASRSTAPTVYVEVPVDAPNGFLPRADPLLRLIEDTARELREEARPWRVYFRPQAIAFVDEHGVNRAVFFGRESQGLAALAECAGDVSRRYGISEAAAVTLILTGEVDVKPLDVSVSVGAAFPALDEVRIRSSARTAPADVTAAASETRVGLLPGQRDKPIGEKSARLAVFAARVNDGRTWQDAMVAWNERFPEDAYALDNVNNFRRDCAKAYRHVTGGAPLEWARPPGRPKEEA